MSGYSNYDTDKKKVLGENDLDINPTIVADPRTMDKKEKKQFAKEKTAIASGASAGLFEQQLTAGADEMVQQLQLSPKFFTHAGPPKAVRQYQDKYNLYTIPLRHVVTSIGRVRDLTLFGAPQSPDTMPAGLKKKFRKLSRDKKSDADEMSSFTDWRAQNQGLEAAIGMQIGSRAKLTAAMDKIAAVNIRMDRKAQQARLAGKIERAEGMESAGRTIANIAGFAYKVYKDLEIIDQFESASLDPQDPNNPLTTQPSDARVRKIHEKLKGYGNAGLKLFSLEEIATVLMFGNEYTKLKQEIAKLQTEIEQLKLDEEWFEIEAVWSTFDAVKIDVNLGQKSVASQRTLTRERAADYAQQFSGKEDARLVMLMAQAYNELSMTSTMAMSAKQPVEANWGRSAGWLGDSYLSLRQYNSPLPEDAARLAYNLTQFRSQHMFLEREYFGWEATAQQWKAFLQQQTGGRSLNS